jgi:hypothetical protein
MSDPTEIQDKATQLEDTGIDYAWDNAVVMVKQSPEEGRELRLLLNLDLRFFRYHAVDDEWPLGRESNTIPNKSCIEYRGECCDRLIVPILQRSRLRA